MSVDFTDEDPRTGGDEYIVDNSPVGLVYIPAHAVVLEDGACIRYERHPWIEGFELDGIKPAEVCCLWQPGAGGPQGED